jgi:hypothetical protein
MGNHAANRLPVAWTWSQIGCPIEICSVAYFLRHCLCVFAFAYSRCKTYGYAFTRGCPERANARQAKDNQSLLVQGIGTDPTGNLYIVDFDNHRIRKVTYGAPAQRTRGQITSQ